MEEKNYRLIMITGLYLGLILFVLAVMVLSKNIEEIKTDPIIYGMEKHEFNSCMCYMEDGRFTEIVLDNLKINEVSSG